MRSAGCLGLGAGDLLLRPCGERYCKECQKNERRTCHTTLPSRTIDQATAGGDVAAIRFPIRPQGRCERRIAIGVPASVPSVQKVPRVQKVVVLQVLVGSRVREHVDNSVVRPIASHICVWMHQAIANHCDCCVLRSLSTTLSGRRVAKNRRVLSGVAQCRVRVRCRSAGSFKNVDLR